MCVYHLVGQVADIMIVQRVVCYGDSCIESEGPLMCIVFEHADDHLDLAVISSSNDSAEEVLFFIFSNGRAMIHTVAPGSIGVALLCLELNSIPTIVVV